MSLPTRNQRENKRMSVALLLALLSGLAQSSSNISNSITVASCRAACLHVFTAPMEDRDAKCRKNSDCFMCWNSCGILRHQMDAWTTMCKDHTVCFPGCQIACGFYLDGPPHKRGVPVPPSDTPPVPLPAYLPAPRVSGRSQVTWASPDWSGSGAPTPGDDVMYVLLKDSGSGWREILQTSATEATLPEEPEAPKARLRLLAVTQEGLVAASEGQVEMASQGRRGQAYTYNMEAFRAEPPLALPNRDIVGHSDSRPNGRYEEVPETHGATREFLSDASTAYSHEYPNQATEIVSLDPTWTIEVLEVHPGPLAEVSVGWSPRGSGGVEYLVSWVEESGSVSGHLLTDQVTSELSLWPGQGYYVQVELIDSQGNPVLRSLATPVRFTKSSTEADEHTETIAEAEHPYLPTTDVTMLTHTAPAEVRIWEPSTEETDRITSAAGIRIRSSTEDTDWSTDMSTDPTDAHDAEDANLVHRHVELLKNHQNVSTEEKDEYISQILQERTYEIVNTRTSTDLAQREEAVLPEVSAKEIQTDDATDRVSEILIWCAGVGIGMLLVLTLCSMVIWLLGRCRRGGPRNEECLEEGLSSLRSSFRSGAAKQNQRNPTTSWTFENFCSTERKPNLVNARKESVPSGIDNASLVENYVIMLESPANGSEANR
ncbi:uncharacterized protein LOC122249983 [Penaeus japonicus]|uniref:uncharacterized protein LOC122249983 n=1 Tax=Penaeus japonicus TaxID=27405 RepID=UPI001C715ABB|nr:uncharacterized protein LOC122249983 [Penaeus japonicus]